MTEESANQLLRIPVHIFPYGPPHTDCLIWTDISSHYDPNAFIESKLNDLDLYYYSVQSYNKWFINRVCSCHTEKYRTLVFQHSPRKLGLYEGHGPVLLSMARADPVNKPLLLTNCEVHKGKYSDRVAIIKDQRPKFSLNPVLNVFVFLECSCWKGNFFQFPYLI